MKYRSSAWGYKLLAWLLIAVCIAFGTLSAFVIGYCLSENYYDEDTKFQTTYHCSEMVRRHSNEIIHQYHRKSDEANWQRLLEGSDLRFIILDEATGEVVESYTEGVWVILIRLWKMSMSAIITLAWMPVEICGRAATASAMTATGILPRMPRR